MTNLYQRLQEHSHLRAVSEVLRTHKPAGSIPQNGNDQWANECLGCGPDENGEPIHVDACPRLREAASRLN